jgi:hypothetical protein
MADLPSLAELRAVAEEDLTRTELAKIALAAWVGVKPEQLPAEKMWIEHPNHDSRKAWDRVIDALRAPLLARVEKAEGELVTHLAHVQAWLADMYATMIDPCALDTEAPIEVLAACQQLMAAAVEQREQLALAASLAADKARLEGELAEAREIARRVPELEFEINAAKNTADITEQRLEAACRDVQSLAADKARLVAALKGDEVIGPADIRWLELAQGSPFTTIDRALLGDMHAVATNLIAHMEDEK